MRHVSNTMYCISSGEMPYILLVHAPLFYLSVVGQTILVDAVSFGELIERDNFIFALVV